jgi:hypothetical protein
VNPAPVTDMISPGISPGAGVGIATAEASNLDAQLLSDKAASTVRAARAARVAWLIRSVMTHRDSSAGQPGSGPERRGDNHETTRETNRKIRAGSAPKRRYVAARFLGVRKAST